MLAGKSGIEIAREVVAETAGRTLEAEPGERYDRSPEYWIGWAVAYYQWYSSRRFGEIFNALPFYDLLAMYSTLHEADITKFAGVADERMREYYRDTNLKRIRILRGFSQAELAKESGVSLRSVQMYEQRRKDINRAGAGTLFALAKALGCTMEDLIEK